MKPAVALLLAAALLGAAPQTPTPQFRSSSNVVQVEVSVVDRDGTPVTDLTSADFVVKELGEPQRIQAMYLVTADPALAAASTAPSARAGVIVPERRALKQRTFVFSLDMAHLSPAGLERSRKAIAAFLGGQTLAGDIFGLVVDGKMLNNHLTTDKAEVLKGLDTARLPNSSTERDRQEWPRILDDLEASDIARNDKDALDQAVIRACQEEPGQCQPPQVIDDVRLQILQKARTLTSHAILDAHTTLQTINTLAAGLGRLPGAKQLVLFSEGFYIDSVVEELKTITSNAARSNVRISSLDAAGLNRNPVQQDFLGAGPARAIGDRASMDVTSDVMSSLAIDTGGLFLNNRNDLGPALTLVAAEASTYYVLGYAPATPPDGKYRAIEVNVMRPGLSVSARRGYMATVDALPSAPVPEAAAPAAASTPAPPSAPIASAAPNAASAAAAPALHLRPDSADHVAELAAAADHAAPPAPGAAADAVTLANDGWGEYAKGQVQDARDKLAAAVGTGAAPDWAWYALGHAEGALSHFQDAAAAWETVRKHQPGFEPVYFDLADAYLNLDRTADVIAVLRDAIHRWPNDPEGHNALGVTFVRRGALDDGIAEFMEATLVAPGSDISFYNLGRAYQLRYVQAQQNASRAHVPDTQTIDAADRQKAIDAYTRCTLLNGQYAAQAKEAIKALEWK